MPGRDQAVHNGQDLERQITDIGLSLGLDVRCQVRVGRRIWGAVRRIDIVLRHPDTRQTLGVECKFQGGGGSAEEKIPATVQDIVAWPIPGIVVFAGQGFSDNMRSFLYSTGKAVDLEDLETWLQLFFGLDF
jgi:hypothetical protein